MRKTALLFFLSISYFTLFAQSETPTDTFTTTAGVKQVGWLIWDKFPDSFKFKTTDNYTAVIPYIMVADYSFHKPLQDYAAVSQVKEQRPRVNLLSYDYYKTRRTTGIVLTSLGLGILTTGIGIMAGSPQNAHSYSNANGAGVNFTGVGAVGFLMAFVSPALFISGSVIWAKANRHIHLKKYHETHPKDL